MLDKKFLRGYIRDVAECWKRNGWAATVIMPDDTAMMEAGAEMEKVIKQAEDLERLLPLLLEVCGWRLEDEEYSDKIWELIRSYFPLEEQDNE